MEKRQISLWLPEELLAKMEQHCDKTKMTRTGLIELAIEQFLTQQTMGSETQLTTTNQDSFARIEKRLAVIESLIRENCKEPFHEQPKQDKKDRQELPDSLMKYLETARLHQTQAVSIRETLEALISYGGEATAEQIAKYRGLKRPESIRRQIERLEQDNIIIRDRTVIPQRFKLREQYWKKD